MKYRIWTQEETDILLQLISAAKTISEIQKVFPYRTESSIRSAAAKHGLTVSRYSSPEINFGAFKELMKGGKQKCL